MSLQEVSCLEKGNNDDSVQIVVTYDECLLECYCANNNMFWDKE